MKIAIFTDFAVNYLAKARVMAATVKKQNPNIDVVALVADQFPSFIQPENEPFAHIWMVEDYPQKNIKSWIFRHNIMELATAIKGWGLQRLLRMGYDYVIYLDPDCWVLEDPALILNILPADKSVSVVPHTTSPACTDEEIRVIETSSLRQGIYNLGFLLVKNDENGNKLADWWAARLERYCIDDFEKGLFTDQRWFDLAVGYFDFIHISRHAGIDVASWNVGQRHLVRSATGYKIDGDPLIFYHFSGVGPAGVHRWVREKFAPSDPLVAELEFEYEKLIEEQGQSELVQIKPFFESYSDGTPVAKADRALYRDRADLSSRFPDPYEVGAAYNFKKVAEKARPIEELSTAPTHEEPPSPLQSSNGDARQLFDPTVYQLSAGLEGQPLKDMWFHYLAQGWSCPFRPNRFFDPFYYINQVDSLDRSAYPTPLHHYLDKGLATGLSPNWVYDDGFYLSHNKEIADVIRSGSLTCGFEHFSFWGWKEGRAGCAFFNESTYLARHPDVAAAIEAGTLLSGEQHYSEYGVAEGRLLYTHEG